MTIITFLTNYNKYLSTYIQVTAVFVIYFKALRSVKQTFLYLSTDCGFVVAVQLEKDWAHFSFSQCNDNQHFRQKHIKEG